MKPTKLLKTLVFILTLLMLTACGTAAPKTDSDTPTVLATNFALYDIARQVAGDEARVEMLLAPGAEAHDYEITLSDAARIAGADLFLCVGGESEDWVGDVFASMDPGEEPRTLCALDCCLTLEETRVEGMQEDEEEEEEEGAVDEHVWTSFGNMKRIAEAVAGELSVLCPDSADKVAGNAADFAARADALADEYRAVIGDAARRLIVVADRFPYAYLAEEMGLDYCAAFSGCTSNVEASLATVNFLVEKVKSEGIPAVLILELSDGRCADAVSRETGCGIMTFYSGHNVSPEDFAAGVTYLDLAARNLAVLKEVLN